MDKRIAIIGDIHSNLEALLAVLDDCRAMSVTDFLCTGDIVGYGADPKECLRIVRDLGCPVVQGNHDQYIACEQDLSAFNENAAKVVEWTREQLSDEELTYLAELPFVHTAMGITTVHSTLDRPENFGYIFDHLQAEAHFGHQVTPICFHGHTHCPMIFEKQLSGVFRIDPQDFKLPFGRKYFINVGSVGQPRDTDPRAAYAIYDVKNRQIQFRRVPYDIAGAQARIRKAGLPEHLASRLEIGQ